MTDAKKKANQTVALKVEGLSKSFGPTRAVVDVSMEFWAGEIHGLIGENGSGKSTLMSMVAVSYTHLDVYKRQESSTLAFPTPPLPLWARCAPMLGYLSYCMTTCPHRCV